MAIDKTNSKLSRGEGVLKVKAKENKARATLLLAAANKESADAKRARRKESVEQPAFKYNGDLLMRNCPSDHGLAACHHLLHLPAQTTIRIYTCTVLFHIPPASHHVLTTRAARFPAIIHSPKGVQDPGRRCPSRTPSGSEVPFTAIGQNATGPYHAVTRRAP
jgi:hypothetical protein